MLYNFRAKMDDQYEGAGIQYSVKLRIRGEVDALNRKDAVKEVKRDLEADGFRAAIDSVKVTKAKK